jgi:hypothetical protein
MLRAMTADAKPTYVQLPRVVLVVRLNETPPITATKILNSADFARLRCYVSASDGAVNCLLSKHLGPVALSLTLAVVLSDSLRVRVSIALGPRSYALSPLRAAVPGVHVFAVLALGALTAFTRPSSHDPPPFR